MVTVVGFSVVCRAQGSSGPLNCYFLSTHQEESLHIVPFPAQFKTSLRFKHQLPRDHASLVRHFRSPHHRIFP
jgi:hypothetical protein